MLVAYAIDSEGLPLDTIRRLRQAWISQNLERPPFVGLIRLETEGGCLRGQTEVTEEAGFRWLTKRLQALSEGFPDAMIMVAGGGLPPTTLQAGKFLLFADQWTAGTSSNASTSTNPLSVIFNSGITESARKAIVIKG
ncbi:MAG: hypothetical protein ACM3YO_03575 [Bacteroidota bacterium]